MNKRLNHHNYIHMDDTPIPYSTVYISVASSTAPNQTGFTLVEIMVVVVILSVFASAVAISAGSSESRKKRAYYEYLLDSMDYIRLTSAERMQPMGIRLVLNQEGQLAPQVVQLENAFSHHQYAVNVQSQDKSKNAMELSADIRNTDDSQNTNTSPTWQVDDSFKFPEKPTDLSIDIRPLTTTTNQEIQPWFTGQVAPAVIWYGTGQASSANIEIKYNGRLVGDVIQILPDGSTKAGL